MQSGHVFITLGDITQLECDAWLLPTDRTARVRSRWRESVADLDERLALADTSPLRNEHVHALALRSDQSDAPLPVLATVPFEGVVDAAGIAHIARSVRSFVEVAVEEVGVARHERGKRLLAVPNFGTAGGGGGVARLRGELAEALLDTVFDLAHEHDVDIVLVLGNERAFARMQELRKRRTGWHRLPPSHLADAERLARHAAAGRLVPFIGAGASVSAGAPSWDGLLDELAMWVGLDDVQRRELEQWGSLDRAAYLRERAISRAVGAGETAQQGARDFVDRIAKAVEMPRYGLPLAALASLRTPQAITLNYDSLFERASRAANAPRTLIPGAHTDESAERWLLKLHGSVEDADSIVLTRDDYLGYATQREALSAIVKANLLTHHLLFVGFGLKDDHFHRIVHDVRRALPIGSDVTERATAVTLDDDQVAATLWKGQVRMRSMAPEAPGNGRQVEIFLDVLVALATDAHSYLLDDEFATSLSNDEAAIRDALQAMSGALKRVPAKTAGRDRIEQVLRDFGALYRQT